MTGRAMMALLNWSSDQNLLVQAAFVKFYEEKYEAMIYDEALGGRGDGVITFDMIRYLLREFDGTEIE